MQKLLTFFQQKILAFFEILTFEILTSRLLTTSLVLNNRALGFYTNCSCQGGLDKAHMKETSKNLQNPTFIQ